MYMSRSFFGVGRLHLFPGYFKNKSLHLESEEREREMLFPLSKITCLWRKMLTKSILP